MFRPTILLATTLIAAASAQDVQTITIKTLPAQMKYDTTEILVKPGAKVKLTFENADDMPHNLILCQEGTDVVAMCNQQMEKPEEALKRNWIPDDPRILLHSKTLDPKTSEVLEFTAPGKPGDYPYVCSFPGHAALMRGMLRVVSEGPGLTGLKVAIYNGDWNKLPDFSKLTPHREASLESGLVELKFDDYKNQYGAVFTGSLTAPKKGEYRFYLASDDGSRLLVDGKEVVENDGIHPTGDPKQGKVNLEAGPHEFRLEYFQGAGEAELFAGWSGEGFSPTALSKWKPDGWQGNRRQKRDDNVGIPIVVETEPVIYRNFISKSGGRPIAVGYPGGFNLTWSASQLNLALIWRGAFMDAARHWRDRGGGEQPPLGYDVLRTTVDVAQPFAVLASPDSEWPKCSKNEHPEGYAWKGYTLDATGVPTFFYKWNDVVVSDRFDVSGNATAGGTITRTLKLKGAIPANAYLRIVDGTIKDEQGVFSVDGGTFDMNGAQFENKYQVKADGAKVGGRNLLMPASAEMKITYAWPDIHGAHGH